MKQRTQLVILDDEDHIIRLLRTLIPWESLSINFAGSAKNGIDGRTLILNKKPDIVITDIRMPGLDGLSLIADIYAKLPKTDFIIVSGFSQFDYAKNAIAYNVENYLLKPINREELQTTLEKLVNKNRSRQQEICALREISEQKKNSLFSSLIAFDIDGNASNAEEFIASENETARLCIIKIDSSETPVSAKLYKLLADKIAYILKKHNICRAVNFNQDIICFLCVTASEQGSGLREKFSLVCFDLQKISELFPQLRFTLFYGAPITRSFHLEYTELLQILPFRRRKNSPQIIQFERIHAPAYPDRLLNSWNKDCIKMLDSLDPVLADVLTSAFVRKLGSLPENQMEETLIAAGRRLAVKAEERHPARQKWFSCILLPALNLAGSAEELTGRFCNEIKKMIAETRMEKKQEAIRPIRQADAYMRDHYMDYDISLEKVAEMVSLTPSYFSMLYKKETGTGFLEALTAVRIKKAKELLQDGCETIAKIAFDVGYTDTKYFSRIFKKTTGITPNEFRQFYG